MTNRRVCNQVPEVIIRKIAEAANSWCAIREIEKQFGDQDGAVGRDLRTAEARMRAAIADLPEPADARLPWDHRAVRDDPRVEALAEKNYNTWKRNGVPGWVPWVANGNSDMQDEARMHARSLLRMDGYTGESHKP